MDQKIGDNRNLIPCESTSNVILVEVKESDPAPPAAPAVVKKIKWRCLIDDANLAKFVSPMSDSVEKRGCIKFDATNTQRKMG